MVYSCETQNVYNLATEWAISHKFSVTSVSAVTELYVLLWENYKKAKINVKTYQFKHVLEAESYI